MAISRKAQAKEDILKEAQAAVEGLNVRQKAIFDKFYEPAPLFNTVRSIDGTVPKNSNYVVNPAAETRAISDAIESMNKRIKVGQIQADQLSERGRVTAKSTKSRMRIRQERRGTSTKSTLSGKFTDRRGLNALKILGGAQL